MKGVIFCEHKGNGKNILESIEQSEFLIIVQTLVGSGKVVVEKKTYPMTSGGLYFIDGSKSFEFVPDVGSEYVQSAVVVSKEFLGDLASMLEFDDLLESIFSQSGYYVPLKNYKTVDSRFKRMATNHKSKKKYSKALFTSDLISLLNYAVYNITK